MRMFALRKRVRRLEQIVNCFASQNMRRSTPRKFGFFFTYCFMGTVQKVQRKITTAKMTMGQEHGKEHLFEHVDALLVSGFGWD